MESTTDRNRSSCFGSLHRGPKAMKHTATLLEVFRADDELLLQW